MKKEIILSYTGLTKLSLDELDAAISKVKAEFKRISNESVEGMKASQKKKRLKQIVKTVQLLGLLEGFKSV